MRMYTFTIVMTDSQGLLMTRTLNAASDDWEAANGAAETMAYRQDNVLSVTVELARE